MNPPLIPLLFALLAAAWAALLALAEGALAANPQLSSLYLPRLFAEKPERLRRGLSIGRICLLALVALGVSGAVEWWADEPLAALGWLVLLVALTVLTADLLPRLVGLWRSRLLGSAAVRAAAATLGVLAPIFIAAGILDRAFARMFGVPQPKGPGSEIAQREMLLGVFALADTMVSEVMTPRIAIAGVDVRLPFDEVIRQAAAAEFARLPVFNDDLDHIVGVLYAKDLVRFKLTDPGDRTVRTIMRQPLVVPPSRGLEELLRAFQAERVHLAVVEENGEALGIVTLEDVLEEIVGQLEDEFEEDEPAVRPAGEGQAVFRGSVLVSEANRLLGVALPGEPKETLSALCVRLFPEPPAEGESIPLDGATLTVEAITGRQVWSVRVARRVPAVSP